MQHANTIALYLIGSDESGKGDSFGGIAVSAVLIHKDKINTLHQIGVGDSKQFNDYQIKALVPKIKAAVHDQVTLSVDAKTYNQLVQSFKNVNVMLTFLHCKVYHQLLQQNKLTAQQCDISIDEFANVKLFTQYTQKLTSLQNELKELVIPNHFLIRGESYSKVIAAASILARAAFIAQMEQLSHQYGVQFPKGSAHGIVEALHLLKTKRQFHKFAQYSAVCKTTFKNVASFLKQLA